MSIDAKRVLISSLVYLVIALLLIAIMLPIVWIVVTSFKPESVAKIPSVWVFEPTLDNYRYIASIKPIWKPLADTLIVATSVAVLSLAFGTPAAYALARYEFRGRDDLAFWILTFWMSPPVVFVIPLFLMFDRMGLLDTYVAIVLAHTLGNLPFVIWLMREYIRDVPREVEEAALIDGYSDAQVFARITLPLIKPGLVAVGILAFIFSWIEFLFALVLTTFNVRLLTVEVSSYWTIAGVILGPMTAAITISIIPATLFAFILQKHIVRGLTLGAVKGE